MASKSLPKTIITVVLLLFVSVSLVTLIVKEKKRAQTRHQLTKSAETQLATKSATSEPVSTSKSSTSNPSTSNPVSTSKLAASKPAPLKMRKVIVYYFHGNVRCPTCIKIESYAREAIESAFANELRSGKLQFIVINAQKPENEHYIYDYKLVSKSIVVSEVSGNKELRWKNLNRIWELIGDKHEFMKYVQDQVRDYIKDIR